MTLLYSPRDTLSFDGPFDQASQAKLTVFNCSERQIAFKVKTTVPQSYRVKPNEAFIAAHTTMTIRVFRQVLPANVPVVDRIRHKFLVIWTSVPDDYTGAKEDFWKQDSTKLGTVQETKFSCIFTDEQSTLARNVKFSADEIAVVEAVAMDNESVISTIDQMNGEIQFVTYTITRLESSGYEIKEDVQVDQVQNIISKWRVTIELTPTPNDFGEDLDYHCETYDDIRRLNRELLNIARKYQSLDNALDNVELINEYKDNIMKLQCTLQRLLLMLRTEGRSSLDDIKERLNTITNELKELLKKNLNVDFAFLGNRATLIRN